MMTGDPRRASDPETDDYTSFRSAVQRLPLPIKTWLIVANWVGTPLMFVLILVAQDAGWLPSRSRDTVTALNAHTIQASAEAAARIAADQSLAKAITEMRTTLDRNNRVTRVICAIYGRDTEVRNACLWGTGE